MFEQEIPLLDALGGALVDCLPDGTAGATLAVRCVRGGDGTNRVSQDLRMVGGEAIAVPPAVAAALRAFVGHLRAEGRMFEAATMYVTFDRDDGAWQFASAYGYEGGERPRGRPQREGDRWPATFRDLLEQHAVVSLCRQRRLVDRVGESGWNLDLDRGRITFAKAGRTFEAALLGSAGHRAGTWLWAWANTRSGLDPEALAASARLRECGRAWGTAELVAPELPLGEAEGHEYASVAAGVLGYDGYYRCPYDGGSAWVLVRDAALAKEPLATPLRLTWAVTQMTAGARVRHRPAILWAASALGLDRKADDAGDLTLGLPGGGTVRIAFDAHDRVSTVESAS